MDKIKVTKAVANFVVGVGTSKIVSDIVKNNTNPQHVADQAAIYAGSFVIGSMAADKTKEYTSAKIDSAVDWYRATFQNTTP